MAAKRKGKAYGGPWYSNYQNLMLFEKNAKKEFPTLKYANFRLGQDLWREYTLTIDVPEYESRKVVIRMNTNRGSTPSVTVDGPKDSPHRYGERELCMWYPYEPKKENKWVHSDGLLHLLVMIQAHLFREAWWRETDEWLGQECEHDSQITSPN